MQSHIISSAKVQTLAGDIGNDKFVVVGIRVRCINNDIPKERFNPFFGGVANAIRKIQQIFRLKSDIPQPEVILKLEAPTVSKRQLRELAPLLGCMLANNLGFTEPWNRKSHQYSFILDLQYYHPSSGVTEFMHMHNLHTNNEKYALVTYEKLVAASRLPTVSITSLPCLEVDESL